MFVGSDSSIRIIMESTVPIIPELNPNKKYSKAMSLWFVEQNHRRKKVVKVVLLAAVVCMNQIWACSRIKRDNREVVEKR